MAWRLDKSVLRGEIDNRQRGRVTGRVWVIGREMPIELSLEGNAWRDMAGCVMSFTNPAPVEGDRIDLNPTQEGHVGDMTASRKVRVLDVSVEESVRLQKEGKDAPEHMGNALYIEWFSLANGRVVIESVDYRISISEPVWTMTPDEETAQAEANQDSMRSWLEELDRALAREGEESDWGSDGEMDEFEWEKFMKESDARTDKYMEVIEKYQDHPDGERHIAIAMGWDRLEELLDADEKGVFDEEKKMTAMEEGPALETNPMTEGKDWIRTEDGDIRHPLYHHAFNVMSAMWHYCDDRGLLGENGDQDLHEMIFQAQTLCAKLAGALNGLAYDVESDGGFVVACLKRGLGYLDASLAAWGKVKDRNLLEDSSLDGFRNELFRIREEMLRLMTHYRRQRW